MRIKARNTIRSSAPSALIALLSLSLISLAPSLLAGGNGQNANEQKSNNGQNSNKSQNKNHTPKKSPKTPASHAPTQTAVQSSVSFSGEASVVAFTEAAISGTVTIGATGPLPSAGGNLAVSVGTTNVLSNLLTAALNLQSAQALTVGANNQTHSEAMINNFSVTIVATNGTTHTISFNSLKVEADATATASGVVTTGSTAISGLLIDNMAVTVTGAANQVVAINGGTIVINAQMTSGSGNQGEISVAGLLISLQGCLSGPIGFARAGISFTGPPPPPPPTVVITGGEATVVNLTNACVGQSLTIGDTGLLSSRGGILEVNVGTTNVPSNLLAAALSLQSAEALTVAAGNQTHSEVTINDFSITVAGTNGIQHTIVFDFLKAEANATATASGVVTTGSTLISGLIIDNMAVTVTGGVNQTIALSGGGTIVINAQMSAASGNQGGITVAGLFISLDACLSGTIGLAQAGISFTGPPPPPPPPSQCDKITGGGFIYTADGAKGSFGVSGGIRRGEFWGHLNYIDHGSGMHVTSTEVTGYAVVDANTRKIDYAVDIDGSPGACTVLVTDNGEPGRDDVFDITLSNGYHAGGDLGGSGSGGGNIQLHKCPPGWAK